MIISVIVKHLKKLYFKLRNLKITTKINFVLYNLYEPALVGYIYKIKNEAHIESE